jgi:PAS domain S-box-containing protein
MKKYSFKKNPLTLKYRDKSTENIFLDEYFNNSLRYIRIGLVFAAIGYSVFSIQDYFIAPELIISFLLIRFAIVVPLLFGVLISYSRYFRYIMQPYIGILVAVITCSFLSFIAIGGERFINLYSYGGLFVIIFGYTLVQLRFIWATVAGFISTLFYFIIMMMVINPSPHFLINMISWFIAVTPLSMFIAYRLEVFSRKEFESKKQLSHINSTLEERVKQKTLEIEQEKTKLETLLRDLGEGIIATDLNSVIIAMNKQAEEMSGKKYEECKGKIYDDIFNILNENGERISLNNYPVKACIKKRKPVMGKAYLIRKNHEPMPIAITVAPIIFKKDIIGVVGTMRDITKEFKIDLAKTEFISLASHQLQTPMTSVRWFLEALMEDKGLNRQQKDYVKEALTSSKRMIKIVGDFLNVSRLEGGVISVTPEKDDFNKSIKEIIKKSEHSAKRKKQKISFKTSHSEIMGNFDSNLLSQILVNLISNAIRYSEPNTTINISAKKKNKNIKISISDSGIGIAKEDQKRLFTKFFRTKKSAKIFTDGSGLGLYIVKKILDICGGKIKCSSAKEKGSIFTVTLPLEWKTIKGVRGLSEGRIS